MTRPAIGDRIRVRYCGRLVPATVTAHFGTQAFTAQIGTGHSMSYSVNDRIKAGQKRPIGWLPAIR